LWVRVRVVLIVGVLVLWGYLGIRLRLLVRIRARVRVRVALIAGVLVLWGYLGIRLWLGLGLESSSSKGVFRDQVRVRVRVKVRVMG
jgi:hypothetical protein